MTLIAHWPIDGGVGQPSTPFTISDIIEGGSGNHDGEVTYWGYAELRPGGINGRHIGVTTRNHGKIKNFTNQADFRINGEMALMGWVDPDPLYGWEEFIVVASCDGERTVGDSTENSPWIIDVYSSEIRFYWWTSDAWVTVSTTNAPLKRQGFHHLAACRYEVSAGSPGTYGVRFYINGSLAEDVDNGGSGFAGPEGGGNSVMEIGSRKDYVYDDNSYLDSFRFYDGTVTAADVSAVYDAEVQYMNPSTLSLGNLNEETTSNTEDNYSTVEGGENWDRDTTDDTTPYTLINTGPLSENDDSGWVDL